MPIRQTFFFLILFPSILLSTEEPLFSEIEREPETVAMNYMDATIYGIIEGVTEFLPISSTGHLIIASELLENESSSENKKEAINAYLIVIQGGAILAVALIYRLQVWSMLLGILGMNPSGRKLLINLISAFLPAAFLGLLLDDLIESYLFGLLPVALALFAGGLFMAWAEKRKKSRERGAANSTEKSLEDLTLGSSLLIGFLQCVAMWPGTSRSMMTIVGGYLVGLSRVHAAEFSFLLGLITLTAAAGYKCVTKWEAMNQYLTLGPVILGCIVAGVFAGLSVFWLVGYLTRKGLGVFVIYRIILSIIVFSIFLTR
ncbi:MAG TPA: undecaprenyl-diphosphate phosphatase [Opitutae bacterium]|nr:undecaprenyl-diphosphate phosphatase [Opitutae bacterium]|tara:strand:- start:135 stop:1082 length:948 start_codon:yes stop_codon:yes gene_type:complete